MSTTNTLVFYRIDHGRIIECGRREMTANQRLALYRSRLEDIFADNAILDDFNRDQSADSKADAYSVGNLIVQMVSP